MCGSAPIAWGSKSTSVNFSDRLATIPEHSTPSWNNPRAARVMDDPTCHSKLKGLHPDMSSGAAEIYAASVALTEVMHLSYIVDEMGAPMELPLQLLVDNTTAIAFSKGNVRRSKLKHIDVRQEWVKMLRDKNVLKAQHIDTALNLADIFTKILAASRFTELRDMMMTRM